MSYQVDVKPLKPYSRGVSIIGVGATPFMLAKEDPATNGLFEGELIGYAAIEAMKDAGIKSAKDVDFFVHAQAGPGWQSNFGTPAIHVVDWFGMKGKPTCHHSEACCTGYVALEQAVSYVASGAYDVVLAANCDMSYSIAVPDKPSFCRRLGTDAIFHDVLFSVQGRDYNLWQHASSDMALEGWLDDYAHEQGITDKMEDVMLEISKNMGRAAKLNPLSLMDGDYDDLAHQFGLEDADEFLRSKFNPKLGGKYCHASNMEQRCDGAAAIVVCPTEMASQYTDHPIEVLGIGHSCIDVGQPELELYATDASYRQVRDLTGLTGKDMDLLLTNDFLQESQLLSAEVCEYTPKGKAWEYALEDRTAFDGDRPINTNGGRCQFGHAHGTSGLMDHVEAVRQMRGECGPTQVSHPVKYAMLRGFGGGQNLTCAILENTNA